MNLPFDFDLDSFACYISVPEKFPPPYQVSPTNHTSNAWEGGWWECCLQQGCLHLFVLLVQESMGILSFGKCVWGQGLWRGGFCPFQPLYLYPSISHISLAPITLACFSDDHGFFLSSPLFNSVFAFFLNWSLIKLRIFAQGFYKHVLLNFKSVLKVPLSYSLLVKWPF